MMSALVWPSHSANPFFSAARRPFTFHDRSVQRMITFPCQFQARATLSLRPLKHYNLPRPGRFLLNRAQARRRGGGEDRCGGMHVEAEAGTGEPHDKVHHLLTRACTTRQSESSTP